MTILETLSLSAMTLALCVGGLLVLIGVLMHDSEKPGHGDR